ncbi:MAG: hypothetical protein FWG69_01210 [Oscillospiraceae bacterium]|nr:hypothetical protein [Oscillospiraceae bacterium]
MRKLSVLMILLMLTTILFACTGTNRGTSPDSDPDPESEEEIFYSEQESSEATSLDELSSDPENEEESSEDISEAESVIIDTSSDTVETDKSKTSRSKSSKKSKKSKQSETPVKTDKPVKPVKISKDDFLHMKMTQVDYMPEGTAIPFRRAEWRHSVCHNECNRGLARPGMVKYGRAMSVNILKTFKGVLYKEGFLDYYSLNCKKQKNKKAVSPTVLYRKFRTEYDNIETSRRMTQNDIRKHVNGSKKVEESYFDERVNILLNASGMMLEGNRHISEYLWVDSLVRKGNELYVGIKAHKHYMGMAVVVGYGYDVEVKKSDIEGITKIYCFAEEQCEEYCEKEYGEE